MESLSHVAVSAAIITQMGLTHSTRPLDYVVGIGLCLLSHPVLDSFAHTDPVHFRASSGDVNSKVPEQWEMFVIAIDGLAALALTAWLAITFGSTLMAIGCLAAIAPDGVYLPIVGKRFIGLPVVKQFTAFHEWIHFPLRPSQRWWGLHPQAITIALGMYFTFHH